MFYVGGVEYRLVFSADCQYVLQMNDGLMYVNTGKTFSAKRAGVGRARAWIKKGHRKAELKRLKANGGGTFYFLTPKELSVLTGFPIVKHIPNVWGAAEYAADEGEIAALVGKPTSVQVSDGEIQLLYF